jgi:hypothetical protein
MFTTSREVNLKHNLQFVECCYDHLASTGSTLHAVVPLVCCLWNQNGAILGQLS